MELVVDPEFVYNYNNNLAVKNKLSHMNRGIDRGILKYTWVS